MESSNKVVPVATMVKKQGGATYVFAVAMKPGETQATFALDGLPAGVQVEVLGEDRKIEPADGKFQDHFGHLGSASLSDQAEGGTKMMWHRVLTAGAVLLAATIAVGADQPETQAPSPYAQWKNGPSQDPAFFPIAVWCQEPNMAPEYQKAGINLYFALWQGPTEAQLAELKKHGMPVICDQNAVGLAHIADPIIVGWMHGDEPDNAQGPERRARAAGQGR